MRSKQYTILLFILTFCSQTAWASGTGADTSNAQSGEVSTSSTIENRDMFNKKTLLELKRKKIPAELASAELKRGSCIARELFLDKSKSISQLSVKEVEELSNLEATPTLNLADGLYISISCQYGYHVKNFTISKIFRVSTGRTGMATKTGEFSIYYQYNGWWESTLYPGSMMYRPRYFYKNMALHGLKSDSSVKPYPASHGCIRVAKSTMDYIWENIDKKTLVKVYK